VEIFFEKGEIGLSDEKSREVLGRRLVSLTRAKEVSP
jgi:hypothetical protein